MPRSCIYPGCGLKAKKFHPETFHDLPFRYKDPELLQQWLVVLKMDITTPLETLKKKRYRVCSRHFHDDDFYYPNKVNEPKKSTRVLLKRNAIPRVGPPAADIEELHGTWAGMDSSPGQVRSTGIQANVPETSTATMEKPTLQHIVDEEAILQLMKNCPMCNRNCRCTKRTRSPYFIVYQSCYYCNYQRKWANQPEARNMDIRNKKLKPTNKVSVNAKAQSSQLNNKCISES